jgi:hypothetical protein
MQLMFEGSLPDTSIGTDILEVTLNQNIQFSQPAVSGPNLPFSLDTTINLAIPISLNGKLTNSAGDVFSVPPSSNQTVTQEVWNGIAALFDTTLQITINLPEIPSNQLPSFIKSVDGMQIIKDSGSKISDFKSTFTNKGLPTNITNPNASLVTDITSPAKTLAQHSQSTISKDATFGPTTTSLSQDSLGNAIRMDIGFGIASTSDATVTINSGDSVQVNMAIQLRIAGVASFEMVDCECCANVLAGDVMSVTKDAFGFVILVGNPLFVKVDLKSLILLPESFIICIPSTDLIKLGN